MKSFTRPVTAFLGVSVFLSGVAALIYEIVFARYLAIFLGHDGYAVLAVLVTFMGGLALGSSWLGGLADASASPCRFFALLELAIGVYGLIFPVLTTFLHGAFGRLSHLVVSPNALLTLKPALAIIFLLVPTVLMGGTIPAVVRASTYSLDQLQKRVGTLYSLNSLGGAFGCLLSNFFWIPRLGLPETLWIAAFFNLLSGGAMLWIDSIPRPETVQSLRSATPEISIDTQIDARFAIVTVAVSGFAAMLYEVVWTRVFALVLASTTDAFSIMLATFITGIAVGSAIISCSKLSNRLRLLGWVQFGVFASVALTLPLYSTLPFAFARSSTLFARTANAYPLNVVLQGLVCVVVMFIPALLLGVTLPLASQIASSHQKKTGQRTGIVFGMNTIGGVVGALLTGIWFMPAFGLARSLGIGIAANLCNSLWIFSCRNSRLRERTVAFFVPAVLLVVPWICGLNFDKSWQRALTLGLWRDPGSIKSATELKSIEQQNDLRYYRDGIAGTVSVNAWREAGKEQLNLRVNGKPDASTSSDMATQLLLGHIPMLVRSNSVQTALIVGLGSGVTSGAVARYDSLKRVDTIEISADVAAAAATLFSPYNGDVLRDPRMRLILDDARSVLERTQNTYDIIVSEPSNPWISGIAGLFTREFYDLCRKHLNDRGLMAQWVHLYDNNQESLDLVLRTFSTVFPYVSVWQSEELDLILIGSTAPWKPDLHAVISRFDQRDVRADLQRIHLAKPSVLLSLELITPADGRFMVSRNGVLHTDSHPTLEFLAQRAFFEHKTATRWLRLNQNLATHPKTLMAAYLAAYPLTPEDYAAFAEFHSSYRLPSSEIMRSICVRWQNDPLSQHLLLRWLPRLPIFGSAEELEALRLASIREKLLGTVNPNPELLEYYAKLLLFVYRSQRSIFYLPSGNECRNVLERLISISAKANPFPRLELAELAWDHGDTQKCIVLSNDVLQSLDFQEFRGSEEFCECLARYGEALLTSGKAVEAARLFDRIRSAGLETPLLDLLGRKCIEAKAAD